MYNIFLLLGTTIILSDLETVDVLHQQINLPSYLIQLSVHHRC